jgi:ubiquinone/menaquinone biosynthesis C-methylase UbiE
MLGDIRGQTFLDYGSGTGRSAQFLCSLGASMVYGVDHDAQMVKKSRETLDPKIDYILIDKSIPLPDNVADGALCACVFIELRTMETMKLVCSEISRMVKPGAIFAIMSTNPEAFGRRFSNFSYTRSRTIKSGDVAVCTVKSGRYAFDIRDTYWEEADYRIALESAGFRVDKISRPKGDLETFWETDEARIAPFIVIRSVCCKS